MRKTTYYAIVILLVNLISCSDEDITNEHKNTEYLSSSELDYFNSNFKNDLISDISTIKHILQTNQYAEIYENYELAGIKFDFDYLLIDQNESDVTYNLVLNIPSKNDGIDREYAYLSFSKSNPYHRIVTFGNHLGLQMAYNGLEKTGTRYGSYTSKPKYKKSKVPKSVLCRYHSSRPNGSHNQSGGFTSLCGFSIGIYRGPLPASVQEWLDNMDYIHNYQDLYIPTLGYHPVFTDGLIPFNSFYSYRFPNINNHIIDFYQKVKTSYGFVTVTTSDRTVYSHLNKQAFIDSWFSWIQNLNSNSPNNAQYLFNNPSVYYQLFDLFADINANNDEGDGLYLGLQFGQYSSDTNMRCMTAGSQFLETAAGLNLLNDLGNGLIDINQFKSQLPECN